VTEEPRPRGRECVGKTTTVLAETHAGHAAALHNVGVVASRLGDSPRVAAEFETSFDTL
jgi:hypothetical protein